MKLSPLLNTLLWACVTAAVVATLMQKRQPEGEYEIFEILIPDRNKGIKNWVGVVAVHFLNDKELQKKFRESYPSLNFKVNGFIVEDPLGVCQVYAMRPDFVNDKKTRTLGHELLHCIHGPYHW